MYQPHVLIHQARPSHQILLHQALNAQGIFQVRISENTAELNACLSAVRCPDLVIVDHAMPTRTGLALLKKLPAACPLVFVGSAGPRRRDLAQEARSAGLRVLAELPWPVSTPALQYALQTLQQRPWRGIQTVTNTPHAH